MSVTYKVVETAQVDDDNLTRILNETCALGWQFDSFHFAMRDSSRRPAMAFVLFSRPFESPPEDAESDGG